MLASGALDAAGKAALQTPRDSAGSWGLGRGLLEFLEPPSHHPGGSQRPCPKYQHNMTSWH